MADRIHGHEGRKYLRRIWPADGVGAPILVDIYCVLEAWEVICPARTHAIKKLLQCGGRGKGDERADLRGVLAAVARGLELVDDREEKRRMNHASEYRDQGGVPVNPAVDSPTHRLIRDTEAAGEAAWVADAEAAVGRALEDGIEAVPPLARVIEEIEAVGNHPKVHDAFRAQTGRWLARLRDLAAEVPTLQQENAELRRERLAAVAAVTKAEDEIRGLKADVAEVERLYGVANTLESRVREVERVRDEAVASNKALRGLLEAAVLWRGARRQAEKLRADLRLVRALEAVEAAMPAGCTLPGCAAAPQDITVAIGPGPAECEGESAEGLQAWLRERLAAAQQLGETEPEPDEPGPALETVAGPRERPEGVRIKPGLHAVAIEDLKGRVATLEGIVRRYEGWPSVDGSKRAAPALEERLTLLEAVVRRYVGPLAAKEQGA